jgi:hypothetical protein
VARPRFAPMRPTDRVRIWLCTPMRQSAGQTPDSRATSLPRRRPPTPSLRRLGQAKPYYAAPDRALWRWIYYPLLVSLDMRTIAKV